MRKQLGPLSAEYVPLGVQVANIMSRTVPSRFQMAGACTNGTAVAPISLVYLYISRCLIDISSGSAIPRAISRILNKPASHTTASRAVRVNETNGLAVYSHSYHRIAYDKEALKRCFVDLFLGAHDKVPRQVVLDLHATDDPLHGDPFGARERENVVEQRNQRRASEGRRPICNPVFAVNGRNFHPAWKIHGGLADLGQAVEMTYHLVAKADPNHFRRPHPP